MMAQGIAEGALGALQLFQQMSGQRADRQMQRRRLDQYDRQLDIAQSAEDRALKEDRLEADINNANQNMLMTDSAGFFDVTKSRLDKQKIIEGLESGDAVAFKTVENIARTSGLIDPSVKGIQIVKAPTGDFVIQTSNEDGTFGVITLDGQSDPNSPAITFKTLDEFVDAANVAFIDTLAIQTVFSPAKARAALGVAMADLQNAFDRQGVPQEQRVAIKRMAISGASGLENEEQQAEFINTVIRDQVDPDFVPTLTFKDGKGPGSQNNTASQTQTQDQQGFNYIDPKTVTPDAPDVPDSPAPSDMPSGRSRQQLMEMRRSPEYLARQEAANRERQRARLPELKEELSQERDRLAKLSDRPGRGALNARKSAENKIARLEDEISNLEPSTFRMETEQDKEAVEAVVDTTKDLSTQEVVDQVEQGTVVVTPQQEQQIAQELQRRGVDTVQQVLNLDNVRDRALARVAMIASIARGQQGGVAPDTALQREMMSQIVNLFETGTASMSAKDLVSAEQAQSRLNLNFAELQRAIQNDADGQREAAVKAGQGLMTGWIEKTGGNYSGSAAAQFIQQELGQYLLEAQNAPPRAQEVYLQALNPVVGKILASMAADERGGFMESFVSIFRGDVSDSSVGATDFDLSRVQGIYNDQDQLESFYYRDALGNRLDERVPAGRVKRLNENVFNILSFAAARNRAQGR